MKIHIEDAGLKALSLPYVKILVALRYYSLAKTAGTDLIFSLYFFVLHFPPGCVYV